jgi:CheY-like chemotaxis protein
MLKALLLCEDHDSVRIVTRSFKDLGVEVEHCSTSASALTAISKARFDAILTDDEVKDFRAILETARETASCDKSVRIVLSAALNGTSDAFEAGTQVVIYKPLSVDRVRHGLRAVRNLMGRERRAGSKRVRVNISAKITTAKGANLNATLEDLSETGAALRCDGLPSGAGRLTLEWNLPESHSVLKATAEQVWREENGLSGLRFLDISVTARKMLHEWLRTRAASKSERVVAAKA